MKIMLKSTHLNTQQYQIIPGPDGQKCLTMAILLAWIADLEEQLVITSIRSYSCPVCLMSHQDLDCWQGTMNHTPHTAEFTIAKTHLVHESHPEASTYEFKKEMQKQQNGLSSAVKDFCWEGLPVSPDVFITQDLLHSCYKFIWDHIFEWLMHTIGGEELNHHFQAQPKLRFQDFTNGVSKLSQASGHEHRTYLMFIIAIISGHENVDHSVSLAI